MPQATNRLRRSKVTSPVWCVAQACITPQDLFDFDLHLLRFGLFAFR